ncbi:MAG: hypothetical protein IJ730_03565 [Alphaproteobacteria bacterium]|nr:hypothetical protein [Alphaproteobacteria bacterium]
MLTELKYKNFEAKEKNYKKYSMAEVCFCRLNRMEANIGHYARKEKLLALGVYSLSLMKSGIDMLE